jgi:hypothetical protein
MRTARAWKAMGGAAAMLSALASVSISQQNGHHAAPSVRIYSANGVDVINTSSYVQPEIALSENAYVFVVAMDLDGQIQVLHPDFPGISVKISAHKQLQLPNFFAGFNQQSFNGVYYSAQFQHYSRNNGWGDTRGVAIALASRAPFNLERIEVGGNWDMIALRRMLENRTPEEATLELARYLGAEGEPIGHDYMRFAGASNSYAYDDYGYDSYGSYYSPCNSYYSYFYAPDRFARYAQVNRNAGGRGVGQAARVQAKIVGYDLCGVPIISYGPVVQGRYPGQPRSTGDTTVFPKGRFPHGTPRHPPQSAAIGAFPGSSRTGLPQMGDVTITAPKGRRSEPGQTLNGYNSQPTVFSAPQGRAPIVRSIPTGQPTATGGQPVREYHPEPLVEAPPPSRVPERRDSPAPVVQERPSSPPPPRVVPAATPTTTTTTRSEPLRAAPPDRK